MFMSRKLNFYETRARPKMSDLSESISDIGCTPSAVYEVGFVKNIGSLGLCRLRTE